VHPDAIERSLAGGGLRCTPQRYAVMAFLMEHAGHPTAAEIFTAVNRMNRIGPRSSRATIYNNLRDLVGAGLVREVAVEGRAARFDAKGGRHHHFICDRCGGVEDVKWYKVPGPESGALGRRILRECEVIIRGLCAKCARRSEPIVSEASKIISETLKQTLKQGSIHGKRTGGDGGGCPQ
jgi:Fur family transcriptional regulator, peroxide stress response regulator